MLSIFYPSVFATILSNVLALNYIELEHPSNRSYSLTNEICCNGTIYEDKNSTTHECCGGQLIERATQICCFPEIYPRLPNVLCCGNKSFDISTDVCYTTTHARSRFQSESIGRRVVFPKNVHRSSTCNDKVMNLSTEICCNFQIFPDPEQKLDCCSGNTVGLYDPKTHICCYTNNEDKIILKNDVIDTECCGNNTYDPEVKFCNQGVVADVPTTGNFSVCNETIFDETTEICCQYFIPMKVMKKLEANHDSCCGNMTYNANGGKLLCCGLELIENNRTCCYDNTSYDSKTQTCCALWRPFKNQVEAKIYEGAGKECCGLDTYDVDKQECCGFNIIPKSSNGESGCCSYTAHNIVSYNDSRLTAFTRFYTDSNVL